VLTSSTGIKFGYFMSLFNHRGIKNCQNEKRTSGACSACRNRCIYSLNMQIPHVIFAVAAVVNGSFTTNISFNSRLKKQMYSIFTTESLTLLWFKMNATRKIVIQDPWMKILKISGTLRWYSAGTPLFNVVIT